MKRIYMTAALIGATVFGSYAQKTADLGITLLSPVSNSTYSNFNNPPTSSSDTLLLAFEITNNGPDNVTADDFLQFSMSKAFLGMSTDPNETFDIGGPTGFTLNSGQKDTLFLELWNGRTFSGTGGGTVQFHSNTIDSFFIFVLGFDASEELFTDVGVDPAAGTVGGNNLSRATNIRIGNPNSIISLNGDKKEALEVFPNPAVDRLNFSLNLDKASDATVRIMDLTGRTVLTQDLGKVQTGKREFSVNVSSLNTGLYMIEVATEGKRAVSKFNVKK